MRVLWKPCKSMSTRGTVNSRNRHTNWKSRDLCHHWGTAWIAIGGRSWREIADLTVRNTEAPKNCIAGICYECRSKNRMVWEIKMSGPAPWTHERVKICKNFGSWPCRRIGGWNFTVTNFKDDCCCRWCVVWNTTVIFNCGPNAWISPRSRDRDLNKGFSVFKCEVCAQASHTWCLAAVPVARTSYPTDCFGPSIWGDYESTAVKHSWIKDWRKKAASNCHHHTSQKKCAAHVACGLDIGCRSWSKHVVESKCVARESLDVHVEERLDDSVKLQCFLVFARGIFRIYFLFSMCALWVESSMRRHPAIWWNMHMRTVLWGWQPHNASEKTTTEYAGACTQCDVGSEL